MREDYSQENLTSLLVGMIMLQQVLLTQLTGPWRGYAVFLRETFGSQRWLWKPWHG